MIIKDSWGSTSVSELVNIYTVRRVRADYFSNNKESSEYEKHEILFEFRRTQTKDLISLYWFEVERSLGEKAYLELISKYFKLHTKNKKCLLPKDDYNK